MQYRSLYSAPESVFMFAFRAAHDGVYQFIVQTMADNPCIIRVKERGQVTACFKLYPPVVGFGVTGELPIIPLDSAGGKWSVCGANDTPFMCVKIRLTSGAEVQLNRALITAEYCGEGLEAGLLGMPWLESL